MIHAHVESLQEGNTLQMWLADEEGNPLSEITVRNAFRRMEITGVHVKQRGGSSLYPMFGVISDIQDTYVSLATDSGQSDIPRDVFKRLYTLD